MINGRIELYEDCIKFPNISDKTNIMAHLVYVTPNVGNIIEHAGRTCYRSFNSIKEDSYKSFISNIVKSGHESVIEHSNLIYVILKTNRKDLRTDSNNINRFLINVIMYNGLLKISENQAFYVISGNIRMFKDLVRQYLEIKTYNNKSNPIIDDIIRSFYTLPEYFFTDMINDGSMDKNKFKLNPKFIESNNELRENILNDYVTVINHDNFSFKVRGYTIKTPDGVSEVHRVSIPQAVLKKHNRVTLIINAPRYITHQIVRHRLASYSQASQRYCKEDVLSVYIPEDIKANPAANATANMLFNNALATYNALTDQGIKKEDARSVLTNAQMSTVVMTATVEEFDHFIKVRADKAAQNFIRDMIAVPLKEYMEKYYSETLKDMQKAKAIQKSNTKYHKKQQSMNEAKNRKGRHAKPHNNASGKPGGRPNGNKPKGNKPTGKPPRKQQPGGKFKFNPKKK